MIGARHRWLLAAALLPGGGVSALAPASQRVVDQGIALEFRVDTPGPVVAGTGVALTLGIQGEGRQDGLSGLRPSSWLKRRAPGQAAPDPRQCLARIASALSANWFDRVDVDLAGDYLLVRNDDAGISVLDPRGGFGRTRLLARIALSAVASDWQLNVDSGILYVAQPASGEVALVDTRRWHVLAQRKAGLNPRRVLLAGGQLWVAADSGLYAGTLSGAAPLRRVHSGPVRDLVLSSDATQLHVLQDDGLRRFDPYSRTLGNALALPGRPLSLAWSSAADSVYALDSAGGAVLAITPDGTRVAQRIRVRAGVTQLRFAPDGRFALLPNPQRDTLEVLDAASNRVVQRLKIQGGPDRVAFSTQLAYVQRRASESVATIALSLFSAAGTPLSVAEIPAGQRAAGLLPDALSGTDAMVAAPAATAMWIANPADRAVYFYQEGMAAPAGSFSTYGRLPLALKVVRHGWRETRRGEYAASAHLAAPGTYDVLTWLDSPRAAACFTLEVAAAPGAAPSRNVRVRPLDPPARLRAGQPARLRFVLLDDANRPLPPSADVRALALAPPGAWQQRRALRADPQGRWYELELTPPKPGLYYVWLESAALALPRHNPQVQIYEAF